MPTLSELLQQDEEERNRGEESATSVPSINQPPSASGSPSPTQSFKLSELLTQQKQQTTEISPTDENPLKHTYQHEIDNDNPPQKTAMQILQEELETRKPKLSDIPRAISAVGERHEDIPVSQALGEVTVGSAKSIVGAGEFIVSAATDLAGAFTGLLYIAADALLDEDITEQDVFEGYPSLLNTIREHMRYSPRTQGGKAFESAAVDLFHSIGEFGEKLGDKVFQATESPGAATAARVLPETIAMLGPLAVRRGPKKASETAETAIDNRLKEKKVYDDTVRELDQTREAFETLDKKSKTEMTPEEVKLAGELKEQYRTQSEQVAKRYGADYVTTKKTDTVVKKITEKDLDEVNLDKVNELMEQKDKVTPGPIEMVIKGTKTVITKGREELMAAYMLGEKSVPVRVIAPFVKPDVVDKLSRRVNKVSEDSRQLKEKVEKQGQRTLMEHLREQYDVSQTLKSRISKLLPKESAARIIGRYQQMQNAGTSAARFLRDTHDPIYSQVSGKVIGNARVGDTVKSITDRSALDDLVQSRLILEISKRRPKHKFPGKLTSKEHAARISQLKRDIGETEFSRINDLADQVFDVYKGLLNRRLDEGLISQELYNKLKNFDYEPTRYLEFFDPEIASQSGKGVRSSGVLKHKDGSYDLTDIDSSFLLSDAAARTFNIIARNRVLTELYDAVKSAPENSKIHSHVKIMTPGFKSPRGFEQIKFYTEGKQAAMAVDPYIASVWKTSKDLHQMRFGAGILRIVTGVTPVKALAVGINFTFPLVDVPRAMVGIGFSNTVSLGGKALFGGKNLATQGLFGLPITIGQLTRNMASVAKDAAQHGPLFKQLAEHNAFPQFIAQAGRDSASDIVRTIGIEKKLSGKAVNYLNKALDAMAYPGIYAETVMRMAVAKQALNRGLSISEAATESLRMVAFNEAGYTTAIVDNFIPFFNASFQASRAQFRGFIESPTRATALATSVMSLGFLNYFSNWFTNQDAVKQIADEDLATGFNFVFPKSSAVETPDGTIVHPYVHIPADGAAVPFLAISTMIMRRYNEHREPSGLLLDALGSSTFPLLDVTGAPLAEAGLAIFGNYDSFRGKALYPREAGEPWQEYYGQHEKNATPQLYVDIGRWMWENLDLKGMPIEGLASPERLRKVVDSYLPDHPLSNAFSTVDSIIDPNMREVYRSNWEVLDKAPIVGRFLHITNPNINPWNDMEDVVGAEQAKRSDAKRRTDEMRFRADQGEIDIGTVARYISANFNDVDPQYKTALVKRAVVSHLAYKFTKNLSKETRSQIPDIKWWGSLAAINIPEERARAYYKTWATMSPEGRAAADRLKYQLSAVGNDYRVVDSNGKFLREEARLKKKYGTDFEPGILQAPIIP